jgi:hypothetical protein
MFVCKAKSGLMLMLTEPLFPELNQGQVENITPAFSNFLSSRAENGFTLKDRVKYSYIEFTQAKGFWSITRAFIKSYGTVGRFFIQNEDLTELQKQTQFYQEIGKVQSIFLKFQWQLSNRWWYYDLSQNTAWDALQAFEKLMLSYEGKNYRNVHKILNQGIGKALETIVAGMINRKVSSGVQVENFTPIDEEDLDKIEWDQKLIAYKNWRVRNSELCELYQSAKDEKDTDKMEQYKEELSKWKKAGEIHKATNAFKEGITVNEVLHLPLNLPPERFHFPK